MRKVYCHNLLEAKTLLKEAADRDDLSFDNCQWLTHEGKPLGKSKLAPFWGVYTDYNFIETDQ